MNTGYFLEVCVHYWRKLHETYNDLLFLPKRIKTWKFAICVFLGDKKEYAVLTKTWR